MPDIMVDSAASGQSPSIATNRKPFFAINSREIRSRMR